MKKIAALSTIAVLSTVVATSNADAKVHEVKQGESLWTIAEKYNTTITKIKKINKLDSDIILPSQKLEVLVNGKYEVKKGDTIEKIATKFDAKVKDIKKWNKLKSSKDLKVGKSIIVDKMDKVVKSAATAVKAQPVTHTAVKTNAAPVQQQAAAQKAPASQRAAQTDAAPIQQAPVQQAPVQKQAAPVQQAPVQQQAAASSAAPAGNSSIDAHLKVIAQRESGGNPSAVNPSGYYGLFQFSPSTWASVGGTGNPANASVEEQWKRARILYQTAGASQWSTAY